MHISFAMLPLSRRANFTARQTVETDQSGEPERLRNDEDVAVSKKILCVRSKLHSRRRPGGRSLKKPTVLRDASERKEFVTAAADFPGGAVSRLCAFMPESCPAA
jgi:hypothetical protein